MKGFELGFALKRRNATRKSPTGYLNEPIISYPPPPSYLSPPKMSKISYTSQLLCINIGF